MSEFTSADIAIGYAAMVVSCLGFGLMFVPVRGMDIRDGFFIQWVQCAVVFVVGCAINVWRNFPQFNAIAAVGGILFATGNVFSIPIIRGIGPGLGMLIWGTIQVIVGWGVARFGLFHLLSPSPVEQPILNYVGMALNVICGLLFVFVRVTKQSEVVEGNGVYESIKSIPFTFKDSSHVQMEHSEDSSDRTMQITDTKNTPQHPSSANSGTGRERVQNDVANIVKKKIPYLIMAVCLGILHGLMMSPVDIAKQRISPEVAENDKYYMFDLVFSYFSTVFCFSTLYFIAYCAILRKKAYVKTELVIPSVLYGILWSVGMVLWFLSADRLAQTVAYPVTTRLPAIISSLLEVLLYKTIKGRKNLLYLSFVVLLGIIAVVLIALSNQKL